MGLKGTERSVSDEPGGTSDLEILGDGSVGVGPVDSRGIHLYTVRGELTPLEARILAACARLQLQNREKKRK